MTDTSRFRAWFHDLSGRSPENVPPSVLATGLVAYVEEAVAKMEATPHYLGGQPDPKWLKQHNTKPPEPQG